MTARALFRQADADRLLRAARKAARPEDTVHLTLAPDGTLTVRVESRADNDDQPGNQEWSDDDI